MKVISGMLKGRMIKGFHNPGTRPTMDRVKESLFAIIQDDIKESVILDLFSGSGNLAIEAISQGAKFAYCNDKGREACKIIKENVETFKISEQVEVMSLDFKKALEFLYNKNIKLDIIFLDPPYQTTYVKDAIFKIEECQLLKKGGKMICEVDTLSKVPLLPAYEIVKQKKYGDKYVVILCKL